MTPSPSLRGRRVTVRVPATSANLGPGFDTLGLALAIYDHLTVTVIEPGALVVDVTGVGDGGEASVPRDASNLVARSIAHTFDAVGQPLPGLHLEAGNVIPHGGGLGSSAAAIVSGVVAAKQLLDGVVEIPLAQTLAIATELEGHPDNVAPALFGGLTIAWESGDVPMAKKLLVHRGVSPLVFVPEYSVSTALARSLQPASVPYDDAVFNLSRSALLIAALTESPDLLVHATEDRLHQDYRASAMPATHALVRLLREQGFAAVVSGAGPSVLVLVSDPGQREVAARLVEQRGDGHWRATMTAVDFKGATVIGNQVEAQPQG